MRIELLFTPDRDAINYWKRLNHPQLSYHELQPESVLVDIPFENAERAIENAIYNFVRRLGIGVNTSAKNMDIGLDDDALVAQAEVLSQMPGNYPGGMGGGEMLVGMVDVYDSVRSDAARNATW